MLDYTERYPGQVADDDPDYPHGKAQNVVVEGDGNGTPLEADLVNDIFGLQQALLVAAGVTPSGNPETANDSDFLKALYRLGHWARGWGAAGDDSTDDTAALQAGLDAVSALGSGRQQFHLWPGAIYRHTGLTKPANVDIIGHGAQLKITHATNHGLTISAGSHAQQVKDVVFSAGVANTGSSVFMSSVGTIRLTIDDCTFGASSGCNGKFIEASVQELYLVCNRNVFTGRANATQIDASAIAGDVRLIDSRHTIPATYSSAILKLGRQETWIDRNWFIIGNHSSGSLACIEIDYAVSVVHLDDTTFANQSSDPADAVAIKWGANACTILESNSHFVGDVTPYDGSVVLAEGSSLDLRAHGSDVSTDETYTLPDDFRAFALSGDFATYPVLLTMPTMRFPGQSYDLQIYNSDGDVDWEYVLINALGPNVASSGDKFDNGHIRTGRFVVMRDHFQDRWYWMLIGEWSTMFGRANEVGT